MNFKNLKTALGLLLPVLVAGSIVRCSLSSAQTDETVRQQQGSESSGIQRPKLFDAPMDFTESPEIPIIDGPSPSEIQASIDRGARFLVLSQNPDGSFGSHVSKRYGEIYAPLPGSHHAFRGATTALAVSALIECTADQPEAREAILAARDWMLDKFPRIKQGDTIYNVWTHAYGIQALVKLKELDGQSAEVIDRIDALIRLQITMLEKYESIDGGWGYYDFVAQGRKPTGSSISFVNATVLVALKEAADAGFEVPSKIVERAIAAIKRQQKPDFTYLYGEYLKNIPMAEINRPGGSLGRSQACNLALRLWGDAAITDNVLKAWLYRLYLRNGWLDIGRKRPIPHESWMQVAGYFYYYGHYYAAMCIDQLKPQDRDVYRNLLAKILIRHQEPDGCWWDYTLYNYYKQYGTAFAMMSMQRCLPEKANPHE